MKQSTNRLKLELQQMIVPRFRLLFWVAVVVLPFALIGAVSSPATGVSLLCIGGLLAVVLVDALGARHRLAGIGVALPPVARMSKDREAKLELRKKSMPPVAIRIRITSLPSSALPRSSIRPSPFWS